MKQVYGFKVLDDDFWGDVFDEESNSPEELISSACHMYYNANGDRYIGFDMSLGLTKKEMKLLLKNYGKKIGVYKVL